MVLLIAALLFGVGAVLALSRVGRSMGRPEEVPRTVDRALREWSLLKERLRAEARYRHGGVRELRAKSRVRLEGGRPVGVDGLIVDVTEQRATERQFAQAQRLEAVGRRAGGVAHDFNDLLSVILAYAGFVSDELRESDPILRDVEEIQAAAERAAALTRQLLAFSRRQVLEPEVLGLNLVVGELEGMLRRLLGEDIDISVRLAPELGGVRADPGQLEHVLMNLAVNARDAMLRGGTLTLETATVELDEVSARERGEIEPGRYVMLSVSDTGGGMDAATRERIFEPFFTTKEPGKGTGLGLATVHGIVRQSGGSVRVLSEPGRGTTFEVCLPRVDEPVVVPLSRSSSVPATGGETVLLVEDEDAVRRLTVRILGGAGYRVLAAANGGEALLLCERHGAEVDLLLTDVVMPLMSGPELRDRLASLAPGLRTLFMSGYTDDAIGRHGALEPGARLLAKPFTAAELTRRVREALDAA